MTLRLMVVFLVAASLLGVLPQSYSQELLSARRKRELVERLRWESFWQVGGIREAPPGPAAITVFDTVDSFFYCSNNLGKCAWYGKHMGRLNPLDWQVINCRSAPSPCDGVLSDKDVLMSFVNRVIPSLPPPANPSENGPIRGSLSEQSISEFLRSPGMIETLSVSISSRSELEDYYLGLRANSFASLEKYLSSLDAGGYEEIKIPCFADSDPQAPVYASRRSEEPIIIMLYWNSEDEQWDESSTVGLLGVRTPADDEEIVRLRKLIESIRCGSIRFDIGN